MNLTSLKNAIASVLNTALAPILTPVLNTALTGNTLNTVGKSVVSKAEFVRPADTTPYSQLDVVSSATAGGAASMLQFDDLARANGGTGYITKAVLLTEHGSFAASFRLHLFNTNAGIASVTADNAAFLHAYADRDAYVGYVDFDVTGAEANGAGAMSKSQNQLCRLAYKTAADATKLFGILELRSPMTGVTATPLSGQKFHVRLTGELN